MREPQSVLGKRSYVTRNRQGPREVIKGTKNGLVMMWVYERRNQLPIDTDFSGELITRTN